MKPAKSIQNYQSKRVKNRQWVCWSFQFHVHLNESLVISHIFNKIPCAYLYSTERVLKCQHHKTVKQCYWTGTINCGRRHNCFASKRFRCLHRDDFLISCLNWPYEHVRVDKFCENPNERDFKVRMVHYQMIQSLAACHCISSRSVCFDCCSILNRHLWLLSAHPL